MRPMPCECAPALERGVLMTTHTWRYVQIGPSLTEEECSRRLLYILIYVWIYACRRTQNTPGPTTHQCEIWILTARRGSLPTILEGQSGRNSVNCSDSGRHYLLPSADVVPDLIQNCCRCTRLSRGALAPSSCTQQQGLLTSET